MKNILKNQKRNLMAVFCFFVILLLPQQVLAKGTASDLVSVARSQVGTSGVPNKYTRYVGLIGGSYSYAWCHAFVSWCANEAGVSDKIPRTAGCATGVSWFKARGQWKERRSGYTPKAGDIIYFDYSANGTYDHVGIVTGTGNGRVYTIEGNAGNSVKINGGYSNGYSLSNTDILGYGTPVYGTGGNNPKGCLDIVTGGTSTVRVRGWAIDDDVPTKPLSIHVYVGEPGKAGTVSFAITANKERADVGRQYPGTGNYHGFDDTVTVNTSGTKKVYVYAINEGGGSDHTLLGTKTITINKDTQKPTVNDAKIFAENADGYMLYCTVKDNVKISSVKAATWTERNGQDDIKWTDMVEVEPGVMKLFIPFKEHNNEYDVYHNHIYVKDSSNNESIATVVFDRVNAVLSKDKLANLGTGFYATIINEGRGKAVTRVDSGIVSCTNTKANNQKWKFERNSDGSYSMQLRSNGKYLDNAYAAGTSNSRLITCERNQSAAQKWNIYSAGNGSYYLRPLCSKDCVMDLLDYSNAENAQVAIHTLNTSVAQRFKIIKVTIGVESISLNKSSLTMTAKNQTSTLSATILPTDAANKAISWSSSNTKVATVDSRGKVTAVGNGMATITVKTADGDKTASCKVTVNIPIPVTGVSLNRTTVNLARVGEKIQLTASVNPSNASNKKLVWGSSDTKVATVDNTGKVTAVNSGTTTITVKTADGNKTATCRVTVNIPISVAGVSLNQTEITMTGIGTTKQLTTTISPFNASNKTVSWTSSNPAVASVNSNGTITAKGSGTAYITVKTADGGKTDTCIVHVNVPVTSIRLDKESVNLTADMRSVVVNASIVPADATDQKIIWSSDDDEVATVTNGKITGVSNGVTTIRASVENGRVQAACEVHVDFTEDKYSGQCGENVYYRFIPEEWTLVISGVGPMEDFTSEEDTPWHQHWAEVERVIIGSGITHIGNYAFANSLRLTSVQIPEGVKSIGKSVFNGARSLQQIELPESLTAIGESVFVLTGVEELRIPRNVTTLGFHSLLDIDTIYGYAGSAAEKYAKENGCEFKNLDSVPVETIQLEQPELTFTKKGQTKKLSYTILPDNATNQSVRWNSDNPEVAVVDELGNVTATGNGVAFITVTTTDGLKNAVCKIQVTYTETCNHVWGSYVTDQMPDCERNGEESVYCIRCKVLKTESTRSIPALGHEGRNAGNAKAATTTEEGYTGDVICARCGKLLAQGQSIPKIDNPESQKETAEPVKTGDRFILNNLVYQVLGKNYVKVAGMQNTWITKLSIPDAVLYQGQTYIVTEIAAKAFQGNKYLTSVSVGKNIEKIGKRAFNGCGRLQTITLGKKVQKIETGAFGNCNHLKKVSIKTTKLNTKSLGKHIFRGCKKLTVKIPKKQFAFYKQLFNKQGIPSGSKFVKLK